MRWMGIAIQPPNDQAQRTDPPRENLPGWGATRSAARLGPNGCRRRPMNEYLISMTHRRLGRLRVRRPVGLGDEEGGDAPGDRVGVAVALEEVDRDAVAQRHAEDLLHGVVGPALAAAIGAL